MIVVDRDNDDDDDEIDQKLSYKEQHRTYDMAVI